jgi:uncharacterized protein
MATRDTPFPPGTPSWVDLFTSDKETSIAFYTGLFGWEAIDAGPDFGGYVRLTKGDKAVAGLMAKEPGAPGPDAWTTYFTVADAGASVDAATGGGATVVAPAMAVGPLGSMAVLVDPAGGAFGLWQPADFIGFERYNEPGSVAWNELNSKNFEASKAFYAALFGWTYDITSDTDGFKYVTGQVDGVSVAGIMDATPMLPPEVPSFWGVYFNVDDTDETVEKAVAAGATVANPADDSPFGRIAVLQDPTGAMFLLQSEKLADGSTVSM